MEKEKDIIEIIVDEPPRENEAASDPPIISARRYVKRLKGDLPKRFVIRGAAICAAAAALSLILGIALPLSDAVVSHRLASMRLSDSDYVNARQNADSAKNERDSAAKRLEEKKDELDKFNASQDSLRKITESNDALEQEKNALSDELASKRSALAAIQASLADKTKKTVTWSSGRYTVGVNIAEGRYTVTGTGSISIGSSGKSSVNKLLKSDGDVFTLTNGDIIQIDGNAKFVPE